MIARLLRCQKGFIATSTALAAVGTAVAIGGAVKGAVDLFKGSRSESKSAPAALPAPATPTPGASLDEAKQQAARRRATAAANGGNTNITGGTAYLQPQNLQQKQLLGQ